MGEVAQVEQGEDEDKSRDRFTQEVESRIVDGWASRENPHTVAFVSLSRLEVRVVVQDYQSCPDKGAQELHQQVRHYLAPWEEAEGRETNSYRWVEVALCAELASHVNAEGYRVKAHIIVAGHHYQLGYIRAYIKQVDQRVGE